MRPSAFALCLVLFLTPCLCFADSTAKDAIPDLGTRAAGIDWPAFLGPNRDSKSPEKIRKNWGDDGLPVVWFKKVGEGYSAPSISRGRLFMFDREKDKARLIAMKSETGEELWRQEYDTDYEDMYGYSVGPRTTPVVDDERVYSYGVEGRLRAHRVVDGKVLWDIDTAERFGVVKNFFGVGSTPVVENDLLIVMVGGSPKNSPGISSGEIKGDGSGIVAFDKRTGELRYSITDELASYASPTLVTIGEKRWGLAFTRGGLLGFEPKKGAVEFFYPWRAKVLESVNAANPVVVDDTVFVTETYGPGSALLKVRPGGYDVLREDPRRGKSMESHWATPVYHEGYLYGSSGRSPGNSDLRAVNYETGEVTWKVPGIYRVTLLYADGHFLVLGEYGKLHLVKANPKAFEQVAEMDLGRKANQGDGDAPAAESTAKDPVDEKATSDRPVLRFPAWNAPVLSHGFLYLRGKDQLVCLDIAPNA